MTDAVADQQPLVPPAPSDVAVAAAEHTPGEGFTPNQLFAFSRWVHVGVDAETCDHAEDGECDNDQHFHAWCRLPNQFQHESIREKAMAAKARRIRLLKDPESDAHTIMEFALDEVRATGDADGIIEEIIRKDTLSVHLTAVEELKGDEEFAHIDEDRERLRVLEGQSEEERNVEELEHLRRHVAHFEEVVAAKKQDIEGPQREGLAKNDLEALIDIVRQDRIERDGARQFMDTFSRWQWFLGTMKQPTPAKAVDFKGQRYFASIEHLEATADEVIHALDIAFAELETRLAAQGKGS
jgi:hypothetical protein